MTRVKLLTDAQIETRESTKALRKVHLLDSHALNDGSHSIRQSQHFDTHHLSENLGREVDSTLDRL